MVDVIIISQTPCGCIIFIWYEVQKNLI